MKVRIKKTGEIIEVNKNKQGIYIDQQHRVFDAESLEFLFKEDEHWQDVRERAAIAAMQGILSCGEDAFSYQGVTDEIAKVSVACADSLVEQLKEKK